jgi:CheY-like chemotaxis protein
VQDTGIGMSDVFRQSGAFMPFKQENPYSSGVGLGLSIVRSIAKDMNATLNLESKAGKGTKISLLVPVKFVQELSGASLEDNVNSSEERPSVPRKADVLHILAPPREEDIESPGKTSAATNAALQRSLSENAEAWLGCGLSPVINLDPPPTLTDTSICAMTESALEAWKRQHPEILVNLITRLQQSGARLLIIAESIRSVVPDAATANPLLKQVFIHQPIGPAKLLRAIAFEEGSMVTSPVGNYSQSSSSKICTPDLESPMPEVTARPIRPALRRLTSGSRSHSRSQQNHGRMSGIMAVSGLGQTSEHGRLTSPTASASASATPATSSDLDSQNIPRDTVLLVEDNEVNMKLLVAFMKKLNTPYHCAINGREAVDIYRRSSASIFLVLMDMNMPTMDGFTATTKIRESEEKLGILPRTYITAVTGGTDDVSKTRAFACGVNDFYSKPVRMGELKMVLEKVRKGVVDGEE